MSSDFRRRNITIAEILVDRILQSVQSKLKSFDLFDNSRASQVNRTSNLLCGSCVHTGSETLKIIGDTNYVPGALTITIQA